MVFRKYFIVFILAIAFTLESSLIPAKVVTKYPDISYCANSCVVVAGGWPFPYLIDYPGISPVNSVSLSDGILGMDVIWVGALASTFIFWTCVMVAIVWILGRIKSRKNM